MKKIVFVIILLLLFCYLYCCKEYSVSDDTIRFRVIAASNSNRDILMKELVVKELSGILFVDSNNIEEVRDNIYGNLDIIDKRIEKIFKNNKYNKTYNIKYGLNDFPKKTFLGKKYSEGTYESLVIEIGEAKGNNYFCIMYPSLCMIDYENKAVDGEVYGFKIVDLFKKIF